MAKNLHNIVVPASLFTKTNNIILKRNYAQYYLCNQSDRAIDYLHSAKAFVQTIQLLDLHKYNITYGSSVVQHFRKLFAEKQNYYNKITKYTQGGGQLTAAAVANIYFCAEYFKFSPEWLKKEVAPRIPQVSKFMTPKNLVDTINGLQKYDPQNPNIVDLRLKAIANPVLQTLEVDYFPSDFLKFEQAKTYSTNYLLSAILRDTSSIRYCLTWLSSYLMRQKYALHTE